MTTDSFKHLILIGRAAAGKSEFIDFLKKIPEGDRLKRYHIGAFEEIDDFPILYATFQDEDFWERLGRKRTMSRKRENVYVTVNYDIYYFLTLKLNQLVKRRIEELGAKGSDRMIFIEFARGRDDGFKRAFELLDPEILKETAVLYLDNTFEESLRRNTVRSTDSDSHQTILRHRVPVEVMEYYYEKNDWSKLTDNKPDGYLAAQGSRVPFVTVWNMPESHDFKVLEDRYSPALAKLWDLYKNKR